MKVIITVLILSATVMSPSAQAESILFIGDSHSVGTFGRKLNSLLRQDKVHTVGTYAICGSIASWWFTKKSTQCGAYEVGTNGKTIVDSLMANAPKILPTPLISDLLKTQSPTITIVELGTNYGPNAVQGIENGTQTKSDQIIKNDMRNLALEISHSKSKCFWIALPKTRKFKLVEKHLFDLTQEAVGDLCTVINSLEMISEFPISCGDGLHYSCAAGQPIAEKWAERAYDVIKK